MFFLTMFVAMSVIVSVETTQAIGSTELSNPTIHSSEMVSDVNLDWYCDYTLKFGFPPRTVDKFRLYYKVNSGSWNYRWLSSYDSNTYILDDWCPEDLGAEDGDTLYYYYYIRDSASDTDTTSTYSIEINDNFFDEVFLSVTESENGDDWYIIAEFDFSEYDWFNAIAVAQFLLYDAYYNPTIEYNDWTDMSWDSGDERWEFTIHKSDIYNPEEHGYDSYVGTIYYRLLMEYEYTINHVKYYRQEYVFGNENVDAYVLDDDDLCYSESLIYYTETWIIDTRHETDIYGKAALFTRVYSHNAGATIEDDLWFIDYDDDGIPDYTTSISNYGQDSGSLMWCIINGTDCSWIRYWAWFRDSEGDSFTTPPIRFYYDTPY